MVEVPHLHTALQREGGRERRERDREGSGRERKGEREGSGRERKEGREGEGGRKEEREGEWEREGGREEGRLQYAFHGAGEHTYVHTCTLYICTSLETAKNSLPLLFPLLTWLD